MPSGLFVMSNINIKPLKLTALLILSPLFLFAQNLTGLWVGTLHNDSATIRKDQSFEIALTEYKDKVYGYSRSEFIVNDTLYYIVKRVKGTIENDRCEVTDDKIVAYNFRGKLDKGVKVTSTFRRNKTDSSWYLEGTWKTNSTKKFYAVTGKVGLEEEKDLYASKLFPHLEELNLANDVAFYKDFKDKKEEVVVVKIAKPERIKSEYTDRPQQFPVNSDIALSPVKPTLQKVEPGPVPVILTPATIINTESKTVVEKEELEENLPAVKKPVSDLSRTGTANIPSTIVAINPTPVTKTVAWPNKQEKMVPAENTNITVANEPAEENKNVIAGPVAKTVVKKEAEKTILQPDNKQNQDDKKNIVVTSHPDSSTIATTAEPNKPEKMITTENTNITVANKPAAENKNVIAEPVAKNVVKKEAEKTILQPDNKQNQKEKKNIVATSLPVSSTIAATTQSKKPELTIVASDNTIPEKKEIKNAFPVVTEIKQPDVDVITKASVIGGRKSEFTQVVDFKSDSLELSLYDNGEIDGDTVSVFLNGEVLMYRQGLKASAIKKTIYITPGHESFTLVMFAENLGKYPPNTGLLVVHDGDDVYNLRFSSDLQKSSGIVFRKKN